MLGHSELSVDVPVPVVFVLQFYCCLDSWNAESLRALSRYSSACGFCPPVLLLPGFMECWVTQSPQ